MPSILLLGTAWGDEGKGKASDIVACSSDIVVKFNGGNNAGHTIVIGNKKYGLHLLPSGILSPTATSVIANGVVVDINVLFSELDELSQGGHDISRLKISLNAHILTKYHIALDKAKESYLGAKQIGTTGRGIGPAYADKINRIGIRFADILNENLLYEKIENALLEKNHILKHIYAQSAISADEIFDNILSYKQRLLPYLANTSLYLNEALDNNKKVIFEGGQGTLLDIDHGTYPFVTSSVCVSSGALSGSGIAFNRLNKAIGISKSYITRVGQGVFPTEVFGNTQDFLQTQGHEIGVTTGRKRRVGWLDIPLLKYSLMLNGIQEIILTKLDVLSGLDEIKVCVAYKINGKEIDIIPENVDDLNNVEPIYKIFKGWGDISDIKDFENLPQNAKDYIKLIEDKSGVFVSAIGTGPQRDKIIIRKDLFE